VFQSGSDPHDTMPQWTTSMNCANVTLHFFYDWTILQTFDAAGAPGGIA
jgi:hypothetical protein